MLQISNFVKVNWDLAINYPLLFVVFFFFFRFCIVSRLARLWRQELNNSFLEFNVQRSDLKMMKYFSRVHNWHTPVTWVKGWALAKIFHVRVYSTFLSFRSQIYLLRVVSCFLFLCVNDDLCPEYLFLKLLTVRPTYVSVYYLFSYI